MATVNDLSEDTKQAILNALVARGLVSGQWGTLFDAYLAVEAEAGDKTGVCATFHAAQAALKVSIPDLAAKKALAVNKAVAELANNTVTIGGAM